MSFSVDPAALSGLSRSLGRLGDDARASNAYLDKNTDLRAGEGLFNTLLGGHQAATEHVNAFLASVNEAAAQQSARLDAAAHYYRATDAARAHAFDSIIPRVA